MIEVIESIFLSCGVTNWSSTSPGLVSTIFHSSGSKILDWCWFLKCRHKHGLSGGGVTYQLAIRYRQDATWCYKLTVSGGSLHDAAFINMLSWSWHKRKYTRPLFSSSPILYNDRTLPHRGSESLRRLTFRRTILRGVEFTEITFFLLDRLRQVETSLCTKCFSFKFSVKQALKTAEFNLRHSA